MQVYRLPTLFHLAWTKAVKDRPHFSFLSAQINLVTLAVILSTPSYFTELPHRIFPRVDNLCSQSFSLALRAIPFSQ